MPRIRPPLLLLAAALLPGCGSSAQLPDSETHLAGLEEALLMLTAPSEGPAAGSPLLVPRPLGEFYVRTTHPNPETQTTQFQEHYSSTWGCTGSVETEGSLVVQRLVGCTLADPSGLPLAGDFDLTLTFTAESSSSSRLDLELDSRLEVGIDRFRFVYRIDPASMPAAGDDVWTMPTAYNTWVQDPVSELTLAKVDWGNARNVAGGYRIETGSPTGAPPSSGFYLGTLKPTQILSVHTPAWGLAMQGLDPDSSDPGWNAIGSNGGALDFGYEFWLPRDNLPGNGPEPVAIGGGFRIHLLPADEPVEQGWWETVSIYRQWKESAGLLPPPLASESPFSEWADTCAYQSFTTLGPTVEADEILAELALYRTVFPEQDDLCPLIWGWDTGDLKTPKPGFLELLAGIEQLNQEDFGPQIHPLAYLWSQGTTWSCSGDDPLGEAVAEDRFGRAFSFVGPQECSPTNHQLMVPGDPAFQDDMIATATWLMEMGVDGLYMDSPFPEWVADYGQLEGHDPELFLGTKDLFDELNAVFAPIGGGVILSEGAREGLTTMLGHHGLGSGGSIPGANDIPLEAALQHDRSLVGLAGDVGSQWLSFVAADATVNPAGLPGNAAQIHRLFIDGAVEGRALFDTPTPLYPRWWMIGIEDDNGGNWGGVEPFLPLLQDAAQVSYRNAQQARQNHPVLVYGRMLAPPDSNVAQVTIAAMKLYAPYGLYTFDRPELSHTLWEGPAGVELVVGNPTYAEQSPSFSLDRSRYPELGSGQIMALLFDSAGQQIGSLGSFDGDIGITVPVPPLDLSVVRFVAE